MYSYLQTINELACKILSHPIKHLDYEQLEVIERHIKKTYTISSTTITQLMGRLLFSLAALTNARKILVLGSYEGIAASYLIHDTSNIDITCVDIDAENIDRNKYNFTVYPSISKTFKTMDAGDYLVSPIEADLIFYDVEDKDKGKHLYVDLYQRAKVNNRHKSCLHLFHDVCVPKFKATFDELSAINNDYIDVPIDHSGIRVLKEGAIYAN
ncbi:hypothetical protein [Cysteiniphilum sp. 6C5]|uniref:hypothetical protein n=1 Tax=unclassified Cysteiniphilum TaxID=2610889 RepID=UPI003F84CEDD